MAGQLKTTWPQVLAWRLRRQLLDPLGEAEAPAIVRRLAGVQAQVSSATALAVGVRQQTPVPDAVDRALQDGSLMRTWAMRGTLHLLTPDEAGAYLSLVAAAQPWERASWVRTFGVSPTEMATLTEAVAAVLDDRVLTREELVAAVGERLGHSDLEEQLRSGWGAVLKPVAWQGVLCHGPADGNRVTFARPDRLPGWRGVPEPEAAAPVVVPAYLRAYGPATVERFDAWLTRGTSKKAALRGWFEALGDRLATVEVDGGGEDPVTAYLLAEDLDELAGTEPSSAVRLLPGFDQYVMGPGTAAAEIIPPEHRAQVSRTAGWISPVVVAGGRVVGTWDVVGTAPPEVHWFDEAAIPPAADIAAAVERMHAVLTAFA